MTDIILYIAHIVLFFFLGRKYGKELIQGLKGDNHKWDAPEIVTSLWIIMFIIILLANLFLNYDVSIHLWYSMDVILLAALGGRGLIDFINKKK